MSKLLDYSFARPDPANIKNQGFEGVLRYLSPNAGKNLTAGERDALRAAGLGIGLVWEWYANRAVEGRAAGLADGKAAMDQANALGFPQYLPIYFAVDWDATPEQQGPINDYFTGVRDAMAGRKVGVYAGFYPLKRLFDAQLVQYGWQTYAWSGGQWDPRAQLRQTLNGQWGRSVDFDESVADDWGGWLADAKPGPVVTDPKPAPAPNGTHDYAIQSGDTFWGLEAHNGWTHGTLQNLNPSAVATKLAVGQVIKVPGGAAAPAPQPAPAGGTHQIVSGDTFWGLETANGWAHGTLQGLNPGVVATQLKIGQTINVPGTGVTPQPAHPSTAKHKIASGETFWGLETANGWGHGTLQSLNPGQDPTKLQIGQEINIPG